LSRPSSFVALQHRNYRLLWTGQLISFSGSMMQTAAILWHVSLLVAPGRRAIALGLVGLVRLLPVILFSITGGAVADVWDRRRVMLITQCGAGVTALVLAVLTFHGLSRPWPIYALAGLGALAGAFDGPARQAMLPTLVPRKHLANAISLNAIMLEIASVGGPSLGGILIATLGVGWVYAVNAVSFGCVIAALLMMRDLPVRDVSRPAEVSLDFIREGLRFVFANPIIRSTMLLDFFATFFSSATALLPIFAQDVLHVGARGYGWLYAAPSVGAALTSLVMVRWIEDIDRRGVVMVWSVAMYGVATVLFGLSHYFWLTFLCLALTGSADTVSTVIRNVVRQLETPDHLRGRMIGVNMVFFMGGPQLGELEAGSVAQWIGAPLSVITGGIGCLLATAWIAGTTPALRNYHRASLTRASKGDYDP
jgi:MFS family permease